MGFYGNSMRHKICFHSLSEMIFPFEAVPVCRTEEKHICDVLFDHDEKHRLGATSHESIT